MSANSGARAGESVKAIDPIWDSIRLEAERSIAQDPLLAAFLYSTVLNQPSLEEAVIHRVCETEPRAMREVNPGIESWLAAFVGKLMRKDPGQRFQTAEEVARLLRAELAHLQNPTVAAEPPRRRANG